MLKIGLTLAILTCTLLSCLVSPDTGIPSIEQSTPSDGSATNTAEFRPTLPASPIPSPTPPQQYFIEEFNSISPYWSTIGTLGNNIELVSIDEGWLRVRLDDPYSWRYQLFDAYNYEDIRVDIYFEPGGTEPSSTGVICRFSKEAGWYEFTLSRQGTFSVLFGKWLAEDVAQYTPILYDESEYIKPEAQGYELGLGCQSDELWLYINGKLIRKVNVERHGLKAGKIGLTVASYENAPAISTFDWFKASSP